MNHINNGDQIMKKSLFASAVLVGLLSLLGVAYAADEEQDQKSVDVDQVVSMCEEQYSAESYADENERNRLIDQCIESHLNAGQNKGDEG